MKDKKERNQFSFSLKKTDSPIIKDFLACQENCSESFRYLILKYCLENGVENVSNKLNELLYGALANPNSATKEATISKDVNDTNIEENTSNTNSKAVSSAKKVDSIETNNIVNNSNDEDDDIPECYRK